VEKRSDEDERMNMELPKKKTKSTRKNPKSVVIFSQPKTGKTTSIAGLDNCLTIDLEKGSEFVDILKYDVIGVAEENNKAPIVILKQLINKIKEANEKKGGYVYKFIAIDTVTALEEVVKPLAAKIYQNTPMGRNWVGTDITTLPNGAGYGYARKAMITVLTELEELCDTLIILGHVKTKSVNVGGEEIDERSLDLTGKLANIVCAQVDAVGAMYRKDNETIINFKPSESLVSGSRSRHIDGRHFVIVSSDKDNKLTVDWSEVFID
jgi:hypothetical protein